MPITQYIDSGKFLSFFTEGEYIHVLKSSITEVEILANNKIKIGNSEPIKVIYLHPSDIVNSFGMEAVDHRNAIITILQTETPPVTTS